jgi:hypothetical protein
MPCGSFRDSTQWPRGKRFPRTSNEERRMSINAGEEVATFQRITVNELGVRYAAAFGNEPRRRNKAWLMKTHHVAAAGDGGLPERSLQLAEALPNGTYIRMSPQKPKPATSPNENHLVTAVSRFSVDNRQPLNATVLTRDFKGTKLQVCVLITGFEDEGEGEVLRSLSAVAKKITGKHRRGFRFSTPGRRTSDTHRHCAQDSPSTVRAARLSRSRTTSGIRLDHRTRPRTDCCDARLVKTGGDVQRSLSTGRTSSLNGSESSVLTHTGWSLSPICRVW